MIKILTLIATTMLLTACGSSSFACKNAKGVPCASMKTVDALIDQGRIDDVIDGKPCKNCNKLNHAVIHWNEHQDEKGNIYPSDTVEVTQ